MGIRPVARGHTVIIYDLFHILHDFGISPLGDASHLINGLAIRLEDSGWLRMKDEWHSQQPLENEISDPGS